MLKLITINIERDNHQERVLNLIEREKPDVLCLQEAPELFCHDLQNLGYETKFLPMFDKQLGEKMHTIGVAIASKFTFSCTAKYYHQPTPKIVEYNKSNKYETESFGYLMAKITTPEADYHLATTHFWDSPNGKEDATQKQLLAKLLDSLKKEPPHIICGDFNIPRNYNNLYKILTESYTDAIPEQYKSSLDQSLHKLGSAILDEPIFEKFMVDYIFTETPYIANNVRLEFGISDHAAVIADISKELSG